MLLEQSPTHNMFQTHGLCKSNMNDKTGMKETWRLGNW